MTSSPIIVLDEHPDWLNPLYEEFEKRGVPFKKIDISSASYNPLDTQTERFYINRLSPSAAKRGHQAAFNYTYNYLQHLENNGARIINGSHTVLLETSKAYQASLLKKLNISYPKTLVFNDQRVLANQLENFSFPVVLKPNCGGSGAGMYTFHSKKELLDALETNSITLPPENVMLLQEFIQPKDNHIVRVETINGKIIYAMKVFSQGTFNLCPSDSCDLSRMDSSKELGYCAATPSKTVRFELYPDLPFEIRTAVEKIVKEARLECAGIEYLVDAADNWFIYDINALSILRSSFKEEYGIDAWALQADYFVSEYERVLS